MERIARQPDGTYRWDCRIDAAWHRGAARQGLWGVLIICAVLLAVFLAVSRGTDAWRDLWIPLLVLGVVLAIALPLLLLWRSAEAPREQYEMTGDYVKSGCGRSAIYSVFRRTKAALIAADYIELSGRHRVNRIYVPAGDMDFVREYILERLPTGATVRYEQERTPSGG